jgi:hypothetical protein
MTIVVSWDGPGVRQPDRGNEVVVTTVAELDAVFARVEAQAAEEELPYGIQVWNQDLPAAVMLGLGHPERTFLDWLDRSEPHGVANRYAVQSELPPIEESVGFDIFGHRSERGPKRTRVTPAAAKDAAREYLRTAARPTNVEWSDEPLW